MRRAFILWVLLLSSLACADRSARSSREWFRLETRISGLEFEAQRCLSEKSIEILEIGLTKPAGIDGSPQSEVTARLRTRGKVALLRGNHDLAVSLFGRALETSPADADLWNDLSAAKLERARGAGEAGYQASALDAALKALEIDEDHLPALFNAALALTELSMRRAALGAWRALEAEEKDSHWLSEAARHKSRLVPVSPISEGLADEIQAAVNGRSEEDLGRLVKQNVQESREYVETKLLPRWVQALAEEDLGLADDLGTSLDDVARAVVDAGGDRLVLDLKKDLENYFSRRPEATLAFAGHFQNALSADDLLSSWFEDSAAGHVIVPWMTFRLALDLYGRHEYASALNQIDGLLQRNARLYPSLHGRAFHLRGLILQIQGDPIQSSASLGTAVEAFQKVDEMVNAAKSATLITFNSNSLGQPGEAWQWLSRALAMTKATEDSGKRLYLLIAGQWLAMQQRMPRVALLIQNEVVDQVGKMDSDLGSDLLAVESFRLRAEIQIALKRHSAALDDIHQARNVATRISNPALLQDVETGLLFVESQILGSTAPSNAVAKLDSAIDILRSTSNSFQLARVLFQRSRLLMSMGRASDAERDLREAIAEAERQRRTIPQSTDRISFFDQKRQIFDAMVALQLETFEDPQSGLEFSERAKARVMADWLSAHPGPAEIGPPPTEPSPFEKSPMKLPKGTVVVEYYLLNGYLAIWAFDRIGVQSSAYIDLDGLLIADQVKAFREALMGAHEIKTRQVAESLYDLLIRPVRDAFDAGTALVFVPDGSLHWLPFGLLQDSATGRLLLQDHLLALAPSAGTFSRIAADRRSQSVASKARVFFVSAPEPSDSEALDRLHPFDIPKIVERLFPGSSVRVGRSATRQAFLNAAPGFEIVHFGGHSVANLDVPALSTMHFAEDSGEGSGVLYARDVIGYEFQQTELLVLASCRSAFGRISRTEGVQSLARPFLAAGIPAVVSALWNVSDEETARFFAQFYRQLAAEQSPVEALQKTQMHFLDIQTSGVPRSTWGAFLVIGDGLPR